MQMKRPITTKQHAAVDYTWSMIVPWLPRLLGAGTIASGIMKAVSGLGAAQTAMTDFEGAPDKTGVMPMQAHLAMDALIGVGLLGAAAMVKDKPRVRLTLAGLGAFAIVAALTTKPIPEGKGHQRAQRLARTVRERAGETAGTLAGV